MSKKAPSSITSSRRSAPKASRTTPSIASGSKVGSKRSGGASKKGSDIQSSSAWSSDSDSQGSDIQTVEEEFEDNLVPCLIPVSRQRLRAMAMTLKRFGNAENRIVPKDLQNILTDHGVKLSPRAQMLLNDVCYTEHGQKTGMDHVKLWNIIQNAHQRTGRDSVRAMAARNDLAARSVTLTVEQWEQELVNRVCEQVSRSNYFIDIEDLRKQLLAVDTNKTGLSDKDFTEKMFHEHLFPVYGAVINALFKHTVASHDPTLVRWPELLSLIERGQRAFKKENLGVTRQLHTQIKQQQMIQAAASKRKGGAKASAAAVDKKDESKIQDIQEEDQAEDQSKMESIKKMESIDPALLTGTHSQFEPEA